MRPSRADAPIQADDNAKRRLSSTRVGIAAWAVTPVVLIRAGLPPSLGWLRGSPSGAWRSLQDSYLPLAIPLKLLALIAWGIWLYGVLIVVREKARRIELRRADLGVATTSAIGAHARTVAQRPHPAIYELRPPGGHDKAPGSANVALARPARELDPRRTDHDPPSVRDAESGEVASTRPSRTDGERLSPSHAPHVAVLGLTPTRPDDHRVGRAQTGKELASMSSVEVLESPMDSPMADEPNARELSAAIKGRILPDAPPSDRVAVRLLGELSVARGDRTLRKGWLSKSLELIAYLALHPEGTTKDRLIEVLWGEQTPYEVGSARINRLAYRIRQRVGGRGNGGGYVVNERETCRLEANEWWIDVQAFERLVVESERGAPEASESIARRALQMYRGEVCAGWDWPWLVQVRGRYGQLHGRVFTQLAQTLAAHGQHDEAIQHIEAAITEQPFNEDLWRRAIRLEADRGNRGAALKRCEELRDLLVGELKVEPDVQTEELERSLWLGERPI